MNDTGLGAIAQRVEQIQPFYAMALLGQAKQLEAAGRRIIHLGVGEPQFETPAAIRQAGIEALQQDNTRYTPAVGIPALREAIARYYQQQGVQVPAQRILITPGASGALQVALALLVNPQDKVLLTDPGYPCNRHFVQLFGGEAVAVPVSAAQNFQPSVDQFAHYWCAQTVAALVATPANPTGTLLSEQTLSELLAFVAGRGHLLVDEIYQGLVYAPSAPSALALSDQAFVINSFSKYFGMTGWRIGWLVVPEGFQAAAERLAQNLFLAPPTIAQHAALAAFAPETLAELAQRRQVLQGRRDRLYQGLLDLGFQIPVLGEGAFYLYADISRFSQDSLQFAQQLLQQAGVVVTPGVDFGAYQTQQYVRFAYTASDATIDEALARIKHWLGA